MTIALPSTFRLLDYLGENFVVFAESNRIDQILVQAAMMKTNTNGDIFGGVNNVKSTSGSAVRVEKHINFLTNRL